MKTKLTIAVLIVAVIGGLYLASAARRPKTPPPTSHQIWTATGVPVETAMITRGDMQQTAEVTGDITALNSVTLSAKIPGRLASVLIREGDPVSKGQVVAILDQDDARSNLQSAQGGLESAMAKLSQAQTNAKVTKIETTAAIDQAQANLNAAKARLEVTRRPNRTQERMVAENKVDSAKANLDNAEANYKRNESLLNEGAIAPSSFDVIRAQYLVAKADYKSAKEQLEMILEGGRNEDISASRAQVEVAEEQLRTSRANASQNLLRAEDIKSAQAAVRQARASVTLARQQLENTYIRSSISGEVSSRTAEPGQVVSVGQALIAVVDLRSLYFKGDVSENQLGEVAVGDRVQVTIDAFANQPLNGAVTEIYPAGSTTSRNFSVRITILKSDRKVRPGMFARGQIITGVCRNILLIPKDAIDERKGTDSVFIVGPDKTVTRHIVEVVRENKNYVEIQLPTDLKTGDVAVTAGRQNLQEGTKVQERS